MSLIFIFFQFSCFLILNLFLLFVHSEDLRTKNHGLALEKDTASKKFSSKFVFLTVKFALLYFDNGSGLLPFAVYIIVLVTLFGLNAQQRGVLKLADANNLPPNVATFL